MIAIIDYGVGNLFSLRSSLTHLGLEAVVTADAQTIRKADRLILPGVGAFGDAMDKLSATGLVPVIREQAAQKPLLGICLGMQLLFEKSYEYGEHEGLGFVKGEVCPLEPDLKDKSLKVPQHKALEQMPQQSRTIFMLSRYQNLPNKQIAEQLNISLKTVEAHITKALRILRLELKDYLASTLL